MSPFVLRSSLLSALPHINHGWTGRETDYAFKGERSLQHVTHDRAVLARVMGAKGVVTLNQNHSIFVRKAKPDFVFPHSPDGDGLWSDAPLLALGILTADCGAVLLADCDTPRIAALHAGWRGALGGILEAGVEALERQGSRPQNLVAALGPTIALPSYQVGEIFIQEALQMDWRSEPFIHDRKGQFYFDLPGFICAKLRWLGLEQIENTAQDTYSQSDKFFSYRYAKHQGVSARCGRMLGVIMLKK